VNNKNRLINSSKTILFFYLLVSCTTSFAHQKDISLAILMPAPATKIHQNWGPLAKYLSIKLGQPVKIVTPRGIDEAKKQIAIVDFFYANAYLYSLMKKTSKINPVAQMKNTANSIYSKGRFLVRNDSSITNIKDLKGKKMALNSPYGTGAYLAPRAYMRKHGIDIESDVEVEFTRNLKKAAYMILLGEADAAVMCDVTYNILSKNIDTGDLRYFDTTETFPEALVFSPLDPESDLVNRFKQALIEDNSNKSEALKPLQNMKILNFVSYDPIVEERIAELRLQAKIE
jgi:ABC-type phosphate/phosphonate transport system substrate-binding protein